MNLHLLYRRERINELASVLMAGDTIVLMDETLADDFDRATANMPCIAKILSDSATPSEQTATTAEWVGLIEAHRHCISWD